MSMSMLLSVNGLVTKFFFMVDRYGLDCGLLRKQLLLGETLDCLDLFLCVLPIYVCVACFSQKKREIQTSVQPNLLIEYVIQSVPLIMICIDGQWW